MHRMISAAAACLAAMAWSAAASAQELSFEREVLNGGEYTPGEQVTVRLTYTYTGTEAMVALAHTEIIPNDWDYVANAESGNVPAVRKPSEANGVRRVEFVWLAVPAFPFSFDYVLDVPIDAIDKKTISGQAIYRLGGPELQSPNVNTDIYALGETPDEKEDAMCGCSPSGTGSTGILGDVLAGIALCGVLIFSRQRRLRTLHAR